MPTYTKDELEAIRAKPEAERTQAEKDALTAADAKKSDEHMIPKSRLDEVLEQNRALKERLDKMETDQKTAQDKALAEQGKWKELAEARQAKIDELNGKAGQVDTYEGVLKKTLEAQLESLSPEMKKLVPQALNTSQKLEWLAENRSILSKQAPIDIGTGKKGGKKPSGKAIELDDATIQAAASYGMKPEEYVKFMAQPVLQPFGQAQEKSSEDNGSEED